MGVLYKFTFGRISARYTPSRKTLFKSLWERLWSRRKLFSPLTSSWKQVESYDLDPKEQSRHFANFSVLWMGFCLGAEQKNIYMPVIPKYIPVIFHNELQQVSIKLPGCNEKLKHINSTWFKLLWQNDRH